MSSRAWVFLSFPRSRRPKDRGTWRDTAIRFRSPDSPPHFNSSPTLPPSETLGYHCFWRTKVNRQVLTLLRKKTARGAIVSRKGQAKEVNPFRSGINQFCVFFATCRFQQPFPRRWIPWFHKRFVHTVGKDRCHATPPSPRTLIGVY